MWKKWLREKSNCVFADWSAEGVDTFLALAWCWAPFSPRAQCLFRCRATRNLPRHSAAPRRPACLMWWGDSLALGCAASARSGYSAHSCKGSELNPFYSSAFWRPRYTMPYQAVPRVRDTLANNFDAASLSHVQLSNVCSKLTEVSKRKEMGSKPFKQENKTM